MNTSTLSHATPRLSLLALQREADAVRIAQRKLEANTAHLMKTLRPEIDRIAAAYWMGVKGFDALKRGSAGHGIGRFEVRPLFAWVPRWPAANVWNENTSENFRLAEVNDESLIVMVKTPRPGGSVGEERVRIPVSVLDMTDQQIAGFVVDNGKYYS